MFLTREPFPVVNPDIYTWVCLSGTTPACFSHRLFPLILSVAVQIPFCLVLDVQTQQTPYKSI